MNDKLTEKIIGAATEVYKTLGPGLLESAYQDCLFFELKSLGFNVRKEISLPIIYKNIKLGNYPKGLLINFHTKLLTTGIKRFINTPL